ncbi:hypothetical protein HYS49_01415 [Candidatus Woesearchaeota archaeon]|nr:hypothetical protein [Candidatus Woesearchaeota archaeon]
MSNKKLKGLALVGGATALLVGKVTETYHDNNLEEIHASSQFSRLEQIDYDTRRSAGLIEEHLDECLVRAADAMDFRDCVSVLPIDELVDSYISLQREDWQIRTSPAYAALRARESEVEDNTSIGYGLLSLLSLGLLGGCVYLVGKSPKDKNAQKTQGEEPKK